MNLKPAPVIGVDVDLNPLPDCSAGSPLSSRFDELELSAPDLDYVFAFGEEDLPALPAKLSAIATEELHCLCNRMFQELNKNFPRFGAREDYDILSQELQSRPAQ